MEHYLVELDGDQVELLRGMVREAIKVAEGRARLPVRELGQAAGAQSLSSLPALHIPTLVERAC